LILSYGATGANGRAMPADTTRHVASSDMLTIETTELAETAEVKTWQDLWPNETADPEHLLTRRELAERAQSGGISVTERDIANWQARGVLPHGISQRTGRTLQTLYPERYLDLLSDIREEQRKGTRLAAIGPLLWVKHAGKPRTLHGKATITFTSSATARAHVRRGDPALTADDDLAQTLRTIAQAHEEAYGRNIVRVELRLIDDHGNPLTLAVDTD
jgi:hypothetical protein